jgi:hypothetical protein
VRRPIRRWTSGWATASPTGLTYSQRIAALYPGASPDQVLVTTGSAEANYVAARLIEPR